MFEKPAEDFECAGIGDFMRFIFVLILILSANGSFAQTAKPEDIYKRALPSVATLSVTTQGGSVRIGTAFLAIKDGVAVTAWHVVSKAEKATAKFADGEVFEVSGVIDKDIRRDIALIKIKTAGRDLLRLAKEVPAVGQKAFVIGAPKGLDFSFSEGNVSQIQNADGWKQYQFTSPASPGNSGGPLLNENGEVMGVVSFQITDGQNLNFAIPAHYAAGLDSTLPTTPWSALKDDSNTLSDSSESAPALPINIPGIQVEPTEVFFKTIFEARAKAKKTAFETDEEFKQRTEIKIDTQRTYYFVAESQIIGGSKKTEPFSYDAKNQTLSVRGGIGSNISNGGIRLGVIPMPIRCTVKVGERYEARNGFGARVNVTPIIYQNFIIGVTNNKAFSSAAIDFRQHVFGVSVRRTRENAEALSKTMAVLVGVRFPDPSQFRFWQTRDKPTFDIPIDEINLNFYAEATVESIVLIDYSKQEIVERIEPVRK
ncbi:MAG: S1C family serine protease [Capsulimonadales bacterium]|nr:S1C family serine protease [Capsulimonadales bacterium]